ncbi:nickel pincer cofactor biosynthesis protein LarC [Carboxydothermus hydrogenoformans]|uniref:Pyridinium-3,5-bisthiocarboxylic acid mononucleotide nickel insertion protein n=1 Tax=Carboxydothermus hydrogenoformans (strain ATCC BAA-161 / DSM 6008 / Z-2901) TaxID=246194 RepID=Q3ACL7_CARHZ|nr:nickel pincer cofactor biosynthesis protein LarC [Carboxydothermus hydrogenoformans]ABB16071.1 conserved hypothetical protein [Carboxydothermus hydrogenoformans Z-2901]
MKIAYFHCFAGISGDMILGALIDAGLDFEQLKADLAKLSLDGYELQVKKVKKQGISATKVDVIIEEEHAHRHLQDIKKIISESSLPEVVKEKSIQVFTRLAEAEAKVHQTTLEKVHFHEVGAKDAIVDIVGAVIGLWRLGIEEVYSSPIHTGMGFTQSAHGKIPVPAPATLELLKGCPIYSEGIEAELTTPTGAAILTSFCKEYGDMPLMEVTQIGYGAGERDLEIPNVLRLSIGIKREEKGFCKHTEQKNSFHQGEAVKIEANIDDMNPEFYDYLITKFLKAGAMDVYLERVQMKKNRPAILLNLLVHAHQVEEFCRLIFAETTTIGVRTYPVKKYMLPYEIISVETEFGPVPVKVAKYQGVVQNIAPEYEVCRKIADEQQKPLKEIYDLVKFRAYQRLT